MHLYETRRRTRNKDLWAAIAVFFALLLVFALCFAGMKSRSAAREEALIEEAVRRAAVTCYAVEGRYPESLAYLEAHYGLVLDETRYYIRYEIFASNVMPEISVTERTGRA
ncbi:MAG: hypothetical protein Q4C13_07420 [Clostridia bacterium]|nr:hypothetical protein [Clostridia bacterium]